MKDRIKVKLVDESKEGFFMLYMMRAWGECKKYITSPIFLLTEEQYKDAQKYYEFEVYS